MANVLQNSAGRLTGRFGIPLQKYTAVHLLVKAARIARHLATALADPANRDEACDLLRRLGIKIGLTFSEQKFGPKCIVRRLQGGVVVYGDADFPAGDRAKHDAEKTITGVPATNPLLAAVDSNARMRISPMFDITSGPGDAGHGSFGSPDNSNGYRHGRGRLRGDDFGLTARPSLLGLARTYLETQGFLMCDGWIILGRPDRATPARREIVVSLEYDRRAAALRVVEGRQRLAGQRHD